MLKEFKPTILFLMKFALIFGIGSISYSYYVKQYNSLDPPTPDPVTELVGVQTYKFIKSLGYPVKMWHPISQPTVGIFIEEAMEANPASTKWDAYLELLTSPRTASTL